MASKFMNSMPLAGMEAQMQQVPGFKPRKVGMSVSRLEMSRAQGGEGQAEGQGDCGPPGGGSPCGSPGGGCRGFASLVRRFTGEVGFDPFTDRVSRLEGSTGSTFRDGGHRERFQCQWRAQADIPDKEAKAPAACGTERAAAEKGGVASCVNTRKVTVTRPGLAVP